MKIYIKYSFKKHLIMFKNKLFLIPILFISGCVVLGKDNIDISCQEYNSKPNFYDYSMKQDYIKEKSFLLVENPSSSCNESQVCTILERNPKWDFIEVYFDRKINRFSDSSGYYKIYRDYSLKSCLTKEQYSTFSNNRYKNINGEFCIAAVEIKEPISKITLEKNNIIKSAKYFNYVKTEIKVTLNKQIFLLVENLAYRDKNGSHFCKNIDSTYVFMSKDFN